MLAEPDDVRVLEDVSFDQLAVYDDAIDAAQVLDDRDVCGDDDLAVMSADLGRLEAQYVVGGSADRCASLCERPGARLLAVADDELRRRSG